MIAMLPMAAGLAVFQINTLLDSLIAWSLSPKTASPQTLSLFGHPLAYPIQPGSVTALQYAQRLYQFPLGVFGLAIATAIFPALSRAAATHPLANHANTDADSNANGENPFRVILQRGLRLTVFIGLPAGVGLILVRLPLTRVIFERRQFSPDDSARVATVLAGYASAVWAYTMAHVLTRAFYALKDTRTPLRISLTMMLANLVLNLTLVWWLGVAALAWSTAACAVGQVVLLTRAAGRSIRQPVDAAVARSWGRSALLTAAMVVAPAGISLAHDPATLSPWAGAAVLLAQVGSGVLVYLLGAAWFKADELAWLLNRKTTPSP